MVFGMNYRLVLHFCLQGCLTLLALFVFGMFFWILDEWIGWDLLPHEFQSYVEALIFAAAAVVVVLVVGILLGYLGLFAHWLGKASGYPSATFSARTRRRFKGLMIALPVLIGVAAVVDHYYGEYQVKVAKEEQIRRAEAAKIEALKRERAAKLEAEKRDRERYAKALRFLEEKSSAMKDRLPAVVGALDAKYLSLFYALAENPEGQPQADSQRLYRLCKAMEGSFPFSPRLQVVVAAPPPYRYAIIEHVRGTDPWLIDRDPGQLPAPYFQVRYLMGWPTELEELAMEAVFKGEVPQLGAQVDGEVIRNGSLSCFAVVDGGEKGIVLLTLTSGQRGSHDEAFHGGMGKVFHP